LMRRQFTDRHAHSGYAPTAGVADGAIQGSAHQRDLSREDARPQHAEDHAVTEDSTGRCLQLNFQSCFSSTYVWSESPPRPPLRVILFVKVFPSTDRVQFSRVFSVASFSFSTVSNTSELPSHLTVLVN